MTQEDKELILKDLCARLPYGVKATTTSNGWRDVYIVSGCNDNRIYLNCPVYDEGDDEWLIESVKLYLRPMSSMTEEEVTELAYKVFQQPDIDIVRRWVFENKLYPSIDGNPVMVIDWLNSHHFDYRGLIPKGLALEALEGMYNHVYKQ